MGDTGSGEATGGDQQAATQLLSQIPFGAIIGGPLVAGVEAQTLAANATLKYVLGVLFGLDKDGNPQMSTDNAKPTAVMSVTFTFSRGGETAQLTVPLLTLVPIPYLLVETMDINFKAAINATSSFDTKQSSESQAGGETSGSVGFLFDKVNFKGSYSSKSDSSSTRDSKYSVEYTVNVNVHATGHDMPAGTSKVLNMLNDAIKAVPGKTTT
ncbi:DUF2589 domain-containing protein [Polyangium mundeleinium]|uniref:DUF2589 domain-containing protein n=1 Tax=Polyangium mundeleinium TaxID=2995306 RepID=A0ABT5F5A4_9BACT|nr:DUF2589 domain-containing protein [Polyangium mundeleinium]MDC0748687.1 DUF2589 domain-containing protein [Polyangium mundeleinium]